MSGSTRDLVAKGYVLVQKSKSVCDNVEKMMNVRTCCLRRIGQSCHMRSTFAKRVWDKRNDGHLDVSWFFNVFLHKCFKQQCHDPNTCPRSVRGPMGTIPDLLGPFPIHLDEKCSEHSYWDFFIKLSIKCFIGVRDLPLRDMLSLGAWRMVLGCSEEIIPSPLSPCSPAPF